VALAPSLLLGLLVAGILHVMVKRDKILGHLGKPGFMSSAKAALVGVPLPLCSCGVLPAALSLKRDGASDGAVTSFLISTPQTGVDSIAVTWGILGLPVALAKVAAAFLAGILGGTLADRANGVEAPPPSPACVEGENGGIPARIWRYSVGTLFRDIYGWIALGIAVSALITVLMEPGQLARYPVLGGPVGLLAALALGIPLYVCSVASVPIAAGLIYAGFPVGSALVFLMAGPATNAATMGAVRKTLGGRVFLIYILTVVGVSLAAGLLLNSLEISVAGIHSHAHGTGSLSGILASAAAAFMLAAMAWFALGAVKERIAVSSVRSGGAKGRARLRVGGMTCGGCERRVRTALESVSGVTVVSVSAGSDSAVIEVPDDNGGVLQEALSAVREAGYEAEVE
jgi:uncharacterized membrane protein YraQ (UPF0718 family)/copper chaperone CopZ